MKGALDLYEKALALISGVEDGRESTRLKLALKTIDLLDGVGRFEEALDRSRLAVASLAGSELPREETIDAYVQMGRLHERTGDLAGPAAVFCLLTLLAPWRTLLGGQRDRSGQEGDPAG